jgi:8-oxo-dGTP diphosphatase
MPPQVRVGVGAFILSSSSKQNPQNPTFLIGKRLGSHGAGTFALPGGHLEFGESPEECASREILEETGLQVKNIRFLTATNDVLKEDGKHHVTMFVVCERVSEGEEARVMEVDKCEGWEWSPWEELVGLVRREQEAKEGEEVLGRRLFQPLVDLVVQRPGVVPTL